MEASLPPSSTPPTRPPGPALSLPSARNARTVRVIILLVLPVIVLSVSTVAAVHTAARPKVLTTARFAAFGDYGSAGQNEADVANLVRSWNPDFITTLGDNNYEAGCADTIDANIGQYYHDFIYPYTGSYGPGATSNKFFPAMGNHEWDTCGPQPYLDYFGLPGNERYYDYSWGPVHIFVIDSDEHEPDGNTVTSTQAVWLQGRLAAATEPWKLVYMHHPPYSSGSTHGSTPALQWPYQAWGASAVLAAHDHEYERLDIGGTPYFVNGLGGRSRYDFGTPLPQSVVRYSADYGAMLIDATAASITFRFYSRAGTLIDTYTLGTPEPTPSGTPPTPSGTPPTPSSTATPTPPASSCESIVFTNTVNVTVSGNSIQKTSGSDGVYDAGARSAQQAPSGDFAVQYTVDAMGTRKAVGLNHDDLDPSFPDIDYAFLTSGSSNTLYIAENGVQISSSNTYAVGDVLRVAAEGGAVKFYKNGVLVYTSPTAPTYPLFADMSINTLFASITNVQICAPGAAPATPTATLTSAPTNTPIATVTNTPIQTVTRTPTPATTRTNTPTNTPSNGPTNTSTRTPTRTPTRTHTNTPTNTFVPANTQTNTPTRTGTPVNTRTGTPTNTFAPTSTGIPTNTPISLFTNTPTPVTGPTGRILSGDESCESYKAGSSTPLTEIRYQVRRGENISNAQPGIFMYYVQITAGTEGCFPVEIQQTVAPDDGPLFQVHQAERKPQVHLYNFDDCSTVDRLVQGLTATDGGVTFNVCGATAGRRYLITVKYGVKTIVGEPDPGHTCDYSFRTLRGGLVVDQINNVLHLVRTR